VSGIDPNGGGALVVPGGGGTIAAADITDATATGIGLVTAANADAARTAIGAVPTSRTVAGAALSADVSAATLRTALVADASAWADADADWRLSALAYGATSCPNARTPGTYDLAVPSGGSYNARNRLATLDVAGRFSGGWQCVDTGTSQSGGAVLPVSGAGASGDRLEPAGAFTVVAWVTPLYTHTGSFTRFAVIKRRDDATWGGGGVYSSLQLGIEGASDGRPYVLLRDGSSDRQIDAARPLPLGRLTQLAVTLSGATGTATLWIDGVSQGTIAVTSGMTWGTATTRSWCLGANAAGAGLFWAQEWPGWLGRVGVWSRALSAAELLDDVRAVRG